MKRIVCFVLLAGVVAFASLSAESLTLQELTRLAYESNIELEAAYKSVAAAREDMIWKTELGSSRLSLSGSYAYKPSGAEEHVFSGQAQLTVPIIPQIGLSGSVTSSGIGNASLTFTPFAQGDALYREEEVFLKASVQLEYLHAKLPFDMERSALGAQEAMHKLDLADRKLELEEESYEISMKMYELEELSYEELEDARNGLLDARQGLFDAQRGVASSKVDILSVLSITDRDISVTETGLEELMKIVENRAEQLEGLESVQPTSLELEVLLIERDALTAELGDTWVYRPNLSASVGLDVPLSVNGGITFSFSPDDIKTDEREDIAESIEDKQREVKLEQLEMRLQHQMLDQNLSIYREVVEVRTTELGQARTALAEAELLFEQGERTSLELVRSRLSVTEAESRLFSAVADMLAAQAELLLLYFS